jgi:carboxy-cis,cis-muconate cyclase
MIPPKRYGSHAIEFCPSLHLAFVPVLGSDSIETYFHNSTTGLLSHLSSTPSPRGSSAHDGPRHVKVHPNGQLVYSVTEHCTFLFLLQSASHISDQPITSTSSPSPPLLVLTSPFTRPAQSFLPLSAPHTPSAATLYFSHPPSAPYSPPPADPRPLHKDG